jgi:hypothetical protein
MVMYADRYGQFVLPRGQASHSETASLLDGQEAWQGRKYVEPEFQNGPGLANARDGAGIAFGRALASWDPKVAYVELSF